MKTGKEMISGAIQGVRGSFDLFIDFHRYRMALDAIKPLTGGLEIVGEFRQGLMPCSADESEDCQKHEING